MTPTWLTEAIAADLPVWVGAMARHPRVPGRHLVVEVAPEGAVWTRCDDGRGAEARSFLPGHLPAPDLDHRPTRLEFTARLAERLGAPAEVAYLLTPGTANRNLALVWAWIAAGGPA